VEALGKSGALLTPRSDEEGFIPQTGSAHATKKSL
jgi:hypothetical protein